MGIILPEQTYFIHLLFSVLHGIQPQEPPENIDWGKLYKQSARHFVSNIVFYGVSCLEEDRKPSPEIMAKLHRDHKKALVREATQHIAVEQLLNLLEENHIPCMPLKGYLVKYLYPQPDMRMMADIDILFGNEQTEKVKKLMLSLGYTLEHHGGNHDVYYRRPYMNIEMHRELIVQTSPYHEYLDKTWDRAKRRNGCQCTYELSREDFFIYLLIHLTKHYAGSGTGIRSFLDIHLYNRRYHGTMDWNYIWSELESIHLHTFVKNIMGLCRVWFEAEKSNALYDQMTDYILCCGVYGSKRNAIISTMGSEADVKRPIGAAKFRYRLKLFFPGPNRMKTLFPVLNTLPFLLPLCWGIRGIRAVLFRRKNTFQMMSNIRSVSSEDITRLQELHQKAGLLK